MYFSVRVDDHEGASATVGNLVLDLAPDRYIVAYELGRSRENPHYHIWLEYESSRNESTVRREVVNVIRSCWSDARRSDWALSVFCEDETSVYKGRSYHCKENVESFGGFSEQQIEEFKDASKAYQAHQDDRSGRGGVSGQSRTNNAGQIYDVLSGTVPGWFDLYSTDPTDRRAIAAAIRRHYHKTGRTQPSSYYVRNLVNTYWLSIGQERGDEVVEKMIDFLASEDVRSF